MLSDLITGIAVIEAAILILGGLCVAAVLARGNEPSDLAVRATLALVTVLITGIAGIGVLGMARAVLTNN